MTLTANRKPEEHYRKRAAQMLALAQSVLSERVRQSYLTLAANWFRLAEQAEKAGCQAFKN
jgi:hypothetical protein